MYSLRSFSRTLALLSRTQMGGPPPPAGPFAGMTPMQTFSRTGRTFSSTSVALQEGGSAPSANDKEHAHEETSPQGPSTDEVAKSDAAFSSEANPTKAKGQIESDTNQSMDSSAASEQASKPAKKNLQTSKSEAQGSSTSHE